ncbi:hypothetical protein E2C01_080507 [Portunus trituberculatus]|uniref:Uncharacterized protein n=1 Tax=Portunus trituberculatus TaxID=210409 RepID=A0A5B7IU93_PORTR|nr:hypothetical protein [Portunus trituberculatus]
MIQENSGTRKPNQALHQNKGGSSVIHCPSPPLPYPPSPSHQSPPSPHLDSPPPHQHTTMPPSPSPPAHIISRSNKADFHTTSYKQTPHTRLPLHRWMN